MLEVVPFPAEQLGDWRLKTRLSPQMPYGLTHHDMFQAGGVANMVKWDFNLMGERLTRDERCLGPGLAAYFVKGVLDRDIPMFTDSPVEELICDGKRVVGVRARRDGKDWFVKANSRSRRRGEQLRAAPEVEQNAESAAGAGLDGVLDRGRRQLPARRSLGARRSRACPGYHLFGIPHRGRGRRGGRRCGAARCRLSASLIRSSSTASRQALGNEAFYRSFYYTIDVIDGGDQTHPNFPLLGDHRQPGPREVSIWPHCARDRTGRRASV
jgi:3-oxosteroid 1-dehydrogenase